MDKELQEGKAYVVKSVIHVVKNEGYAVEGIEDLTKQVERLEIEFKERVSKMKTYADYIKDGEY